MSGYNYSNSYNIIGSKYRINDINNIDNINNINNKSNKSNRSIDPISQFKQCKCWYNKFKGKVVKDMNYDGVFDDINNILDDFDNLCQFKNTVINAFVHKNKHKINTVCELGCGDGNRALNSNYPNYTGYDENSFAIELANLTFSHDKNKKFIELKTDTIMDSYDLSISLDKVNMFDNRSSLNKYLYKLFNSSNRYVIIYMACRTDTIDNIFNTLYANKYIIINTTKWNCKHKINKVFDLPNSRKRIDAMMYIYEKC